MSKREIEAAVAAANPVERAALGGERLVDAEQDLIAAIAAEPRRVLEPAPSYRRRRPLAVRAAPLAVAAAAVALFVAIGTGGGPGTAPQSALGAELARLAKASPIIVVQRPRPSPFHRPGRSASARVPVLDCSRLPCRQISFADAVKAGLVSPDFHMPHLPRGVRLVVASPK
jgi:hypothetical protein